MGFPWISSWTALLIERTPDVVTFPRAVMAVPLLLGQRLDVFVPKRHRSAAFCAELASSRGLSSSERWLSFELTCSLHVSS
jgi:hypothetical protein